MDAIDNFLRKHCYEAFMPKAVLFDMDGVLYDSMGNHAKAWHECMKRHGIEMSENEALLYEGMRGVEVIQMLTEKQLGRRATDDEAKAIYKAKSELYASKGEAKLIEGVHNLQEAIARRGWTIGVVTGSGQPTLLQRIQHDFSGLVSPNVIVTAHDVERGKPAPDPYINGMEKAGTQPWQTIVVENAPLGVQAAVAAGCFTIAVNTGPLPDSVLHEAGADLVTGTMNDVTEYIEALNTTVKKMTKSP